jgi:ribonuclease Z
MTPTTVTLTGTGVPHPSPGRAGAGVLVRHGGIAVQFDAGRGTMLRLAEAGCAAHELNAVFVTHVHSDHVVDLADVALTRWVQSTLHPSGPLVVVAAGGEASRFAQRMLDPFADDIALRMAHVQPDAPSVQVQSFTPSASPQVVWRAPVPGGPDAGEVVVEAVGVHHEPVHDAVAYRITTPAGVVVVSGDTRVCDEVGALAAGADVLIHEACRTTAMAGLIAGTPFESIFDYHADTVALGALADAAGVGHLVLTHLIPPPASADDEAAFAADVRAGGFDGPVTVGTDLFTVTISGR